MMRKSLREQIKIETKSWNITDLSPVLLTNLLNYGTKLVQKDEKLSNEEASDLINRWLYRYVDQNNEISTSSWISDYMIFKKKTIKIYDKDSEKSKQ